MEQPSTIEYPTSAGDVVYRFSPVMEFLLCGRTSQNPGSVGSNGMQWHLPKGTPESGELIEETALREVKEETGYAVQVKKYLQEIRYSFQNSKKNITYEKTVHFYLMSVISGDTSLHDSEFEEVKWVNSDDALNLIGYENEKQIISSAIGYLKEFVNERGTS